MIARKLTSRIGTISYKSVNYYASGTPKPDNLQATTAPSSQQKDGAEKIRHPFKATLEADKTYHWCACGHSKKLPFCDGTHKDATLNIGKRPVKFVVETSKAYAICNCQRTKKVPFCDGTHKQIGNVLEK